MKKHCNQCGLDWDSRIERPRACPRCKRYDWNEPKKGERHEVRHSEQGAQVSREVRPGQQSPAHTKRSQELPHRAEQAVGSSETVEPRPDTSIGRDEEAVIPDEDIPEQDLHPEPEMCPYKEFCSDDGETYQCGLPAGHLTNETLTRKTQGNQGSQKSPKEYHWRLQRKLSGSPPATQSGQF
jgi:hypothetical protein